MTTLTIKKQTMITEKQIETAALVYESDCLRQDVSYADVDFIAGARWAAAVMQTENDLLRKDNLRLFEQAAALRDENALNDAFQDLVAENDNLRDTLDDARDEIAALRQKLNAGLKEIADVRADNNRLCEALRAMVGRFNRDCPLHSDDWQLIENASKALDEWVP